MNALLAKCWIAALTRTWRWSPQARALLGAWIGNALWWLIASRRRITLANLAVCFPALSAAERTAIARQCFRNIARAALDHSVLWNAGREQVERYVRVEGRHLLEDTSLRPLIMIAPHFVGLDAGGIRINTLVRGVSIYQRQSNRSWDEWLRLGRMRFNQPVLVAKGGNDLRPVIRALREGLPFYYLPDMDHGATHSVFVSFFGVAAATVPMVSRLARLTGAKVVMAVTEMTDDGYVLHIEAPWEDFPGDSVEADTERMNREVERWVLKMPAQYLWTHRRFKTRPPGVPSVY